jgi:hypothetical protein
MIGQTISRYRAGALALLQKSIEAAYIPYPAMDHNVQFDRIRDKPAFARIRALAIEQQKRLRAHPPS